MMTPTKHITLYTGIKTCVDPPKSAILHQNWSFLTLFDHFLGILKTCQNLLKHIMYIPMLLTSLCVTNQKHPKITKNGQKTLKITKNVTF
jgi:hypothetical protein